MRFTKQKRYYLACPKIGDIGMSNESFIKPEILQAGIDISSHGKLLEELSGFALSKVNEQNGIVFKGETSLLGAMHALNEQEKNVNIANSIVGLQLETLGQATELLGSVLHDDWREQSFSDGQGGFISRIKCLVERDGLQKWVNVDAIIEGEPTLVSQDIANTSFGDLDPSWQKDNRDAARTVVEILVKRNGNVDLSNTEVYEEIGDEIHEAWLARAGWIEPGLEKPFSELSDEQREKDINQMRLALKVFGLAEVKVVDNEVEDNFDENIEQLINEETSKEQLSAFIDELKKRNIQLDWLSTELDLFAIDELSRDLANPELAHQATVIKHAMTWIEQALADQEFVEDSQDEIFSLYRDEALQAIGCELMEQPDVALAILGAVESVVGADFAKLPEENEERISLMLMHGQIRDSELDTEQMLQEVRAGILFDLQNQLLAENSGITDKALNSTIWRLLQLAKDNELEDVSHEDFINSPLNSRLQISKIDYDVIKATVISAYNSRIDCAD